MKFHHFGKGRVLGGLLLLFIVMVAGCGSQPVEKKFLNIATGGTAGI